MSLLYYIILNAENYQYSKKYLIFIFFQIFTFFIFPLTLLSELQKKGVIDWLEYDSFLAN